VAEVDLGALRKNVDVVQAEVGESVGILAVVKADAYGHGAVACARALERKVWGFAVSLVEEGVELRRGGVNAPIVVLGNFYGLSHRDVVAYKLIPVVSDESDLERFARAAEDLSAGKVQYHLKIDSGMSRMGVRPERLAEFLSRARNIAGVELTGLCTHLAEADSDDPDPTKKQLETFARCRAQLQAAGFHAALTHVANSAGTVRFPDARFDLVRPGLALYGYSSPQAAYRGLSPAMSLKSRIVQLRQVPAGTGVSYAGLYKTKSPSVIATVPIGYADGYSRRLTGHAEVLVGGRRCRVVGAITMDMCMVDVTSVEAKVGDEVVLFGAQGSERVSAEEVAKWGGTIVWEVFCGVSKRVPRVYIGERP
jgi:alanine racemase